MLHWSRSGREGASLEAGGIIGHLPPPPPTHQLVNPAPPPQPEGARRSVPHHPARHRGCLYYIEGREGKDSVQKDSADNVTVGVAVRCCQLGVSATTRSR